MTDIFDEAKRSLIMSRIGSRDTGPEMHVRKLLFAQGFRYRLHKAGLPGHPDIVLARYRAVVFVHGCFWHAHGCRLSSKPASRTGYWTPKLARNAERDKEEIAALRAAGWRVLVVWECACPKRRGPALAQALRDFVTGEQEYLEIGRGDVAEDPAWRPRRRARGRRRR
ncbi:MAG: DNA mismatch endonuclease Vsr [Duodenibacillus sp.]|nr:DNA mismatch endonuclease Vsr [Duodenibacillus sp.]